ncbi:penicillin-binding transpeptidase domain-containing protein [Streptomyces sodiiphilus]|uniref:Penicillin-binding transpeptidase domain-containing protein n=1 Tax=Streptomyces sodiiphilus TaxID=226217 RepID=A0ABP5AK38_9ACTN
MRDGQKIAIIGAAFAVVVSAIGVGAYTVLGGDRDPDRSALTASGSEAEPAPEPPTAAEVLAATEEFLTAWSAGDIELAAGLTDAPEEAEEALAGFAEDAAVTELELEPALAGEEPEGASVPFSVSARVSFEGLEGELGYESELTVVRDEDNGDPLVAWEPAVLHPQLDEGHRVETGPSGSAPPVTALDRTGQPLDTEAFPSLAGIVAVLGERYGERAGSTPEIETRIVDEEGERTEQLLLLAEATAGQVPTTIDPVIQRAAEDAVAGKKKASLVAVQPSTGAVQAVANSPADGTDIALQGSYAPGSTWKIVTAGMLIENGLAASGQPHPCPKFFDHGGWEFQNLNEFEIENGTFAQSFAASCNTAFISQAPELADDQLGKYAANAFGVGLDWSAGVPTMDGTVPTQENAQMAAALIGQGAVRANPLVMASVSATVKAGVFRQPYLVPLSFDGRAPAQAAGPSPEAAQQLRQMMNITATGGTAAEAMAGLGGDIGAKTGSAEVMDQDKPNAWFTAYRNDLAVAALVPASGHGGKIAGPLVAGVLRVAP